MAEAKKENEKNEEAEVAPKAAAAPKKEEKSEVGLAPREKESLPQGYKGGPATADNPPLANLVNPPKDAKK